jgi:hypothetical protein
MSRVKRNRDASTSPCARQGDATPHPHTGCPSSTPPARHSPTGHPGAQTGPRKSSPSRHLAFTNGDCRPGGGQLFGMSGVSAPPGTPPGSSRGSGPGSAISWPISGAGPLADQDGVFAAGRPPRLRPSRRARLPATWLLDFTTSVDERRQRLIDLVDVLVGQVDLERLLTQRKGHGLHRLRPVQVVDPLHRGLLCHSSYPSPSESCGRRHHNPRPFRGRRGGAGGPPPGGGSGSRGHPGLGKRPH